MVLTRSEQSNIHVRFSQLVQEQMKNFPEQHIVPENPDPATAFVWFEIPHLKSLYEQAFRDVQGGPAYPGFSTDIRCTINSLYGYSLAKFEKKRLIRLGLFKEFVDHIIEHGSAQMVAA